VYLSLFIENPLIRAVKSFRDRQDPNSPYFNQELVGLKVEEYLNSSLLEHDVLTRSLLCKPDHYPLNKNDLKAAKSILKRVRTISVFDQYESVMNIQSKLMEVMDKKKCVQSSRRKETTTRQLEEYFDLLKTVDTFLPLLTDANKLDIHLYSYVLSDLTNN